MKMINTLTLNPAVDKILHLEALQKNTTNRVLRTDTAVGGKGTHVSMNLRLMGRASRAFGLAGGAGGRYVIDSLTRWGVEPHFIYNPGWESRTNYLLVEEDGQCTLIAEKGESPPEKDIAALIKKMESLIGPGETLVLSGDISNCPDPLIYNRMLAALREKELKVVLDAGGETLREALAWPPYLIKPNLDELSALLGRTLRSVDDVVEAVQELSRYQIEIIAVTLGSAGAVLRTEAGIYQATPPAIKVKNTIGCGDSFLAGLLHGLAESWPLERALQWATAVSAASAESALSVGFEAGRAEALMQHVKAKKILGA